MPAFDASIMREARESDRLERSGPDRQELVVGKALGVQPKQALSI